MTGDRIRVSRALHIKALRDAIDYESSFLGGHDPGAGSVVSCCKPGARCDGYRQAADLLRQFQRELDRVLGPQPPPLPVETVTLAELSRRGRECC